MYFNCLLITRELKYTSKNKTVKKKRTKSTAFKNRQLIWRATKSCVVQLEIIKRFLIIS